MVMGGDGVVKVSFGWLRVVMGGYGVVTGWLRVVMGSCGCFRVVLGGYEVVTCCYES